MNDDDAGLQRLIFEGFGALEIGEFERALRASRELRDLGHTVSFEIEARARWGLEDYDRAIQVLEEGVELAPQVYVLWDYLASYLSDQSRYEDALQAYYRSRDCEDAPEGAVDFNIAVIYQRQDRHERAIALLDTVKPSDHLPLVLIEGAKCFSLNETGKHADAMTKAAAILNQIGENDEVDPEAVARVMSEHAYSLWILGIHEAAYMEAIEAVEFDKSNTRAAWIIREIADERSPDAKGWRMVVEGKWPQPFDDSEKDYGFFANYTVVADSAEEALEYIRPFEPEEVRFTLKINSAVDLEPQPDAPKGVYEAVAAYYFFPLDGSDS
jgi:tetratricopeptide (TPR) repeat protein